MKSSGGLAVICGCAHPGVVNIVRNVKESFHQDVCSLIGGFHLKDTTDEMNLNIIKDLKELGVQKIIPTHCTGKRATKMMRTAFGSRFIKVKEGDNIEL